MGVLTRAQETRRVVTDLFSLLLNSFRIPLQNITIRISSTDKDLVELCRITNSSIMLQIDNRPSTYYRHSIGEREIVGRNFNVALRYNESVREFNDVGNLILLESCGKCVGVEVALGATTIIKEMLGLDHILDCTPVSGIPKNIPTSIQRRLEDIVVTSIVLYREGLRPSSRNNRARLLRAYLHSFIGLCSLTNVDIRSVILHSTTSRGVAFAGPM